MPYTFLFLFFAKSMPYTFHVDCHVLFKLKEQMYIGNNLCGVNTAALVDVRAKNVDTISPFW